MRTFEELKESELNNQNSIMYRCSKKLNEGGLLDSEKKAMKMVIQDCQTYIDNIDEVTTIKIGAITNSLISAIQRAYKVNLNGYWQNFERFIDEYVIGLTEDGKFKTGDYLGQGQCFALGVGVNELSCFKGHDPMSEETCDIFRQFINSNYGTNIPMAGVEEQALRDYETVAFSDDIVAKDKAFIHLKEVQRDSGTLMMGGTYYILATNQEYQEAKARCSERSI